MTSPRESATPKNVREELASLASAVGARVRRERARGKRSVARKPRTARSATPAKAAEPVPARAPLAAAPRAGRVEMPREAPPLAASAPRFAVAPVAAASKPDSSSRDAAAGTRAIAGACATLDELRTAVAACKACGLCKTRTQTVFMDGKGARRIVFVGEAPGADEDRTGVPFVGRAGQLLTDIITKGMGLARDEVWIVNVLKCRPPENRDPTTAEKELCTPFLDRQLELMDPAVIIPLGRHAAMHVLGIEASMGAMRGKVHERNGRKVVPTFHPAYLLRSPGEKKECWKDIQLAMQVAGLPVRGKSMG